jgi:hypothetical protein
MKKPFYRVITEFYADGTVKAAMMPKPSLCREKPAPQFRELPGMRAYVDWHERKEDAEKAVRKALAASCGAVSMGRCA